MAESSGRSGPQLSRQRILAAALDIVDRDGTDQLTMRRLGTELGVDPMAIYYYVPKKAALFDGIMEQIWTSIDLSSVDTSGSWRSQLADVIRALRNTLRAHPRAVSILGTRPVTGVELFALLEQVLEILARAGMPHLAEDGDPGSAADLFNALVVFTIGHVLAEVGDPVGGDAAEQSHLALTVDAFPRMAAVFNSGWSYDPDRQFERGLRALIENWS